MLCDMKVLVTGGAGFIGSHIVDGYINTGHDVVAVDDLSSGKRENVNVRAEFVCGSITDQGFLQTVFKDHGPFDLVNHHAAQKSISRSIEDPVTDANINIIGTLQLLETMRKHETARIIFASTGGALYKEGVDLPATEHADIEPINPYAVAKYSVEHYLRFYQQRGITTQILRYANVYGPRQDPQGEAGVIAIFCTRLILNQSLVITGDGLQTRDFIYIDDVVAASMCLNDYQESGIWNIGTGQETTVLEVANELLAAADSRMPGGSDIEHAPARLGELRRSVLDSHQAQSVLGWKPRASLNKGLNQTLINFVGSIKK